MLVDNEKLSFAAPKTSATDNLAKSQVNTQSNTQVNKSNDDASEVSEIGLSQPGQDLNYLYQLSLSAAKQNPSPVYIGAQKRIELLADSVNKMAQQSGYEYTPEQINRVVGDIKQEINIREIPPGDVNAGSGSVYAFLSRSDKANLADAYQYALDNNTSLKDVRIAAFSLACERFVEAKINSGTSYAIYDPNENTNTDQPNDVEPQASAEVSKRAETDYVKSLLEQLNKGELFMSNPLLRTSLFQHAASSLFNLRAG